MFYIFGVFGVTTFYELIFCSCKIKNNEWTCQDYEDQKFFIFTIATFLLLKLI